MTAEERFEGILAELDAVSDPAMIRNPATAQGRAAEWLLRGDAFFLCPGSPKLVQRYVMATIYFSTNGDSWFQCSGNPMANDDCGNEIPFLGDTQFLAPVHECNWAGLRCNSDMCITEVEFGKLH